MHPPKPFFYYLCWRPRMGQPQSLSDRGSCLDWYIQTVLLLIFVKHCRYEYTLCTDKVGKKTHLRLIGGISFQKRLIMVPNVRLELTTYWLQVSCSTIELIRLWSIRLDLNQQPLEPKSSVLPDWTTDRWHTRKELNLYLWIRNPLLYPLSYWYMVVALGTAPSEP